DLDFKLEVVGAASHGQLMWAVGESGEVGTPVCNVDRGLSVEAELGGRVAGVNVHESRSAADQQRQHALGIDGPFQHRQGGCVSRKGEGCVTLWAHEG